MISLHRWCCINCSEIRLKIEDDSFDLCQKCYDSDKKHLNHKDHTFKKYEYKKYELKTWEEMQEYFNTWGKDWPSGRLIPQTLFVKFNTLNLVHNVASKSVDSTQK